MRGGWQTGRVRDAFDLDPNLTHLNHGSFGAVPRVVAQAQQRFRLRADANPMRFHRVEQPELKAQAREVAGSLLGVGADEVALVRNPTAAVATVLSSLTWQGRLREGDVLLVNSQSYGAVATAVQHWCARSGASYDVVDLPVDATDAEVVAAHREAVARVVARGATLRMVVVDQITSPTGAVLPTVEVAAAAREVGALVLVDGAHAPGHVPGTPGDTGADFWTGTWHKWGFAPRGTSALWVSEAEREGVVPLTTSWNHGQPFPLPFDASGTQDFTAWFALEEAARFWTEAGGWAIAERSAGLLDEAAVLVDKAVTGTGLPRGEVGLPTSPSPCLRMVALPDGVAADEPGADELYRALSARGVEAQVLAHAGRGWIRLSGTVYNELADYERLADLLPDLLA